MSSADRPTEARLPARASPALDDEYWMREALAEARRANEAGEVPIGAIVVRDGELLGRGYNRPIGAGDPTAHAELEALRAAARQANNYRLPGSVLYVTVEPCLMCAGALIHARVERLVFGTLEPKTGAVVSADRVLEGPAVNHHVDVTGGVLAQDCARLLTTFFAMRR